MALSRSWAMAGAGSKDPLHEPVEDRVEDAEVGGQDRDEDQGHGGSLDQRLAIRPLHALELGPAGDEEADHRAARALDLLLARLTPALLLLGALSPLALLAPASAAAELVLCLGGAADVGPRRRRRLRSLRGDVRAVARRLLQPLQIRPVLGQLGLGHIGRLRDLGPALRLALGRRGASLARLLGFTSTALGLPLCSRLRHGTGLAGLFVRRVAPTPAAVLAQLDPVGRVTPRLVGLVVAPFALFASESHGDSHFSA